MNLIDLKIESNRLVQKTIDYHYAEDIFKEFNATITKYMGPKTADNIDETRSFITHAIECLKNGTELHMIITKKDNNEFIGCVGLHGIGNTDPELGIWIKEKAHGNGYGLEAITAMIKWARANIKFDHLKYPVDKRNWASRKIAEKNNGKIIKEYKTINQSNFELDEIEYWIY